MISFLKTHSKALPQEVAEKNYFDSIASETEKEFPEGMMFDYCGISFYVKNYSTCDAFFLDYTENKDQGLWVNCEYFDKKEGVFKEKTFTENFLRNRMSTLMESISK